jgi:hypothetical protein
MLFFSVTRCSTSIAEVDFGDQAVLGELFLITHINLQASQKLY